MHTRVHIQTHTSTGICPHTHAHTYMYTHSCTHTYTCMHIHAHACTRAHTRTHNSQTGLRVSRSFAAVGGQRSSGLLTPHGGEAALCAGTGVGGRLDGVSWGTEGSLRSCGLTWQPLLASPEGPRGPPIPLFKERKPWVCSGWGETALGRDPGTGSCLSPRAEPPEAEPLGTRAAPGVGAQRRRRCSGRSFWKVPWAPARDKRAACALALGTAVCPNSRCPLAADVLVPGALARRKGDGGAGRHGPRRPRSNLPPPVSARDRNPLAVLVLVGSSRSPTSCHSKLPKSP